MEYPGAGQGVLVLGHFPHQGHVPHLFGVVAALGDGGLRQDAGNLPVVIAQLPQHGNDRYHIINIEHTVGDQGIGIFLTLLPDGHGAPGDVHMGGQVIAVRRVEAAVLAHGPANVVIAAVFIAQLPGALGADAHVVDVVDALHGVRGQAVDAEIHPFIFRSQAAGDQVVGVEHQPGRGGNAAADDVRNKFRVGVAHDAVPEQIGNGNIVRGDVGIHPHTGPLVHLQHRHVVILHPARQITALQKGRGNAAGHVGARPVDEHTVALLLQGVRQKVADGGLAVGAGDGDDGLGTAHILQKVRAQLQRQGPGEVRSVVPGDLQRRDGQLRHPQRKQESQFTHCFQASLVTIAAARQLQPSAFSNFRGMVRNVNSRPMSCASPLRFSVFTSPAPNRVR